MTSTPTLRKTLPRDLRRQRWQVAAVVITVVLGVALYAASFDAFQNLSASYQTTYDRLAFADLTISGGDQGAIAGSARSTDGVAAVTQRTQADVPFDIDGRGKLVGRLVGLPADGSQPAVDQVDVLEGSGLDPAQPDGVLVERHLADYWHLGPGDSLTVTLAGGPTKVTVLGVVASPEYLWPARSRQDLFPTPEDFGVLFVPQPLADSAPAATTVDQTLVTYAPGADRATLDAQLAQMAETPGPPTCRPAPSSPPTPPSARTCRASASSPTCSRRCS